MLHAELLKTLFQYHMSCARLFIMVGVRKVLRIHRICIQSTQNIPNVYIQNNISVYLAITVFRIVITHYC